MTSPYTTYMIGPDEFQVQVNPTTAHYVRLTQEIALSCDCGGGQPCAHVVAVGDLLEHSASTGQAAVRETSWSAGGSLAGPLALAIVRSEREADLRERCVARLFDLRRGAA